MELRTSSRSISGAVVAGITAIAGLAIIAGVALIAAGGSSRFEPRGGAPPASRDLSQDLGAPGHECRFWGLVGTGYPSSLLDEHLRSGQMTSLRQLGSWNSDGWGFASYLAPSSGLRGPLIRRGRPPAPHPTDPDFNNAVDEIIGLHPHAIVGHVRAASSGQYGLPNPHPFLEEGWAFAHNGTLPCPQLEALLTEDDPTYFQDHPTEYVDGFIDSELYFRYLLKCVHAHPELSRPEAFRAAIATLNALMTPLTLNFVLTNGDTLYALRCGGYDEYDPVRYYPGPTVDPVRDGSVARLPLPSYWVVASQPVGVDSSGWASLPPRTLGVFVVGREPMFLSVDVRTSVPRSSTGASSSSEWAAAPAPWVGEPWPNPSSAGFTIPVGRDGVAQSQARVTVAVHDVRGALVWRADHEFARAGREDLRWDGRDQNGRPVTAGVYFCRVSAGGAQVERRLTVVR